MRNNCCRALEMRSLSKHYPNAVHFAGRAAAMHRERELGEFGKIKVSLSRSFVFG